MEVKNEVIRPTRSRHPSANVQSERAHRNPAQHPNRAQRRPNKSLPAEASESVEIQLNIIDGAKHATAFPTPLIQGLDWIYLSK